MRDRKRTPAGGVQAEKQQRYAQLIAQGVSNAEACRLVGINRKTGTRWRYGRRVRNSAGVLVHYPPVQIKETRPRSPRYLSEQERIRIADLLSAGTTVRGAKGELALSFLNLLELKTLSMHRGDAALQAIRRALEYVGKELGEQRPLMTRQFQVYGGDLLTKFIETDDGAMLLNASRGGQLTAEKLIEGTLWTRDIDYDEDERARRCI